MDSTGRIHMLECKLGEQWLAWSEYVLHEYVPFINDARFLYMKDWRKSNALPGDVCSYHFRYVVNDELFIEYFL